MGDPIKPWSETRTDKPVELPVEISDKNSRLLNPLAAPDLYFELYDNSASKVTITDSKDQKTSYELVANINDTESSFHGKVIKDPDTGHHIMLFKGMDLPLVRDEGAGRLGFAEDLSQRSDAENHGCITKQTVAAEQAYLELLQNPDVKSLEVIGYSIGSIPANYMASIYGATVTNIADLGVPQPGETSTNFSASAHGLFPAAHGEFKTNLTENVVGLELRGDALGGSVGEVGQRYGQQIVLDEDDLNLFGFAHIPMVYADSARELHNAPETETIEVSKDTQFKAFSSI